MRPFGVLGFFHRKLGFFEVIEGFFCEKEPFLGFFERKGKMFFFRGIFKEIPPFLGRELTGNSLFRPAGLGLGSFWDVVGRGGQPSEGKNFDLHPPLPPPPGREFRTKGKKGIFA